MTWAAFRLEMRRSRSLTFWLALVAGAYAGSMSLFYPMLAENTKLLEDYMKLFPEAFMAAFGMTGSLADPGVFYTTYTGSMVWPIIAAIGGILLGTRAVAADSDRGFLDLPLSTPIPRMRYLATSIAGQVVVMTVVTVVMIAALLGLGVVAGAGFDAGRFLLVVPLSIAFGCAIAAVATLLAVVTLSRAVAGGIVAGLLLAMYLAHVVANLEPDLAWLDTFTAFGYLDTTTIIDTGTIALGDLAVFVLVAVAGWIAALVAFRGRDLAS